MKMGRMSTGLVALFLMVVCLLTGTTASVDDVTESAAIDYSDDNIVVALWRKMTDRYDLFQISVYGSIIVHLVAATSCTVINLAMHVAPGLQKYRIQPIAKSISVKEQVIVLGYVLASQVFIQGPLVRVLYTFVTYFGIDWTADTIPGAWSIFWRCIASLYVEDTFHYFGHRFLHAKFIYRFIHKIHHTYRAPFSVEAEYAHPLETMFLGLGFFVACMLFAQHVIFLWIWLFVRLYETYDVHSGFNLPYNPFFLLPGYAGAAHHDFHHMNFTGNYASSFIFWDRWLGTSREYQKFLKKQRKAAEEKVCKELQERNEEIQAQWEKEGKAAPDPAWSNTAPKRCLVTGGAGMVGKRLTDMLLERGAVAVVAADIAFKTPNTSKSEHGGTLTTVKGDITDIDALAAIFKECKPDAVYHIAALVGPFFPHSMYYKVNVEGTQNVIKCCRDFGVKVLVDCSSPSTRFDGCDLVGRCEADLTYAHESGRSQHEYARTKAIAEKAVLAACMKAGEVAGENRALLTSVVAPHQVYGPEDKLFMPAFLETAAAGRLRVFGSGNNIVSFTHVDNICHGIVLAGQCLTLTKPSTTSLPVAAGQFYLITDGGAYNFWDVLDTAFESCGMAALQSNKFHLSPVLLTPIAYAGAIFSKLTGKFVKLTPFTICMLTIHRYFCIAKAKTQLGYSPVVTFAKGFPEVVAAQKLMFEAKQEPKKSK